jgi:hypothetical protein
VRTPRAREAEEKSNMNRYRTKPPQTALGLMAVAMSFITFGTLVVLPAQGESACAKCQAAAPARDAVAARAGGRAGERERVGAAPEMPRVG